MDYQRGLGSKADRIHVTCVLRSLWQCTPAVALEGGLIAFRGAGFQRQ